MSALPEPSQQRAVVVAAEVKPVDKKDSPGLWRSCVDFLRQAIGMKPLWLAERFAEAKVKQEEAAADERFAKAKGDYEKAMALVRRTDAETEVRGAHARQENAKADLMEALVARLKEPLTPEEALDRLQSTIQQIQMVSGTVEIQLPEPEEPGSGD